MTAKTVRTMPLLATAPRRADRINTRLRRVLALHFDPRGGSTWWLDRARDLGIRPMRDVQSIADLHLFGSMTAADLCERPLLDYIPRALHGEMSRFVVGQTGGTIGGPANSPWAAYRQDEFEDAFIHPFHIAAKHVGFPRGGAWLYAGPSGPHVIGKVVRGLSAGMGAADPFSVDFDPRWAKRLPEGSFAMSRYLDHVIEQAQAIIDRQPITVLFTTPIVLRHLASAMTDSQRKAIRGVHYGGMALDSDDLADLQSRVFPNAVHLSGYGNTLFGCCLELSIQPNRTPEYFPFGERLVFDVVPLEGSSHTYAREGRVRFTRLDDSMLIVNMLERDVAELIPPPLHLSRGHKYASLWGSGLRNPHSPPSVAPDQRPGIY